MAAFAFAFVSEKCSADARARACKWAGVAAARRKPRPERAVDWRAREDGVRDSWAAAGQVEALRKARTGRMGVTNAVTVSHLLMLTQFLTRCGLAMLSRWAAHAGLRVTMDSKSEGLGVRDAEERLTFRELGAQGCHLLHDLRLFGHGCKWCGSGGPPKRLPTRPTCLRYRRCDVLVGDLRARVGVRWLPWGVGGVSCHRRRVSAAPKPAGQNGDFATSCGEPARRAASSASRGAQTSVRRLDRL